MGGSITRNRAIWTPPASRASLRFWIQYPPAASDGPVDAGPDDIRPCGSENGFSVLRVLRGPRGEITHPHLVRQISPPGSSVHDQIVVIRVDHCRKRRGTLAAHFSPIQPPRYLLADRIVTSAIDVLNRHVNRRLIVVVIDQTPIFRVDAPPIDDGATEGTGEIRA